MNDVEDVGVDGVENDSAVELATEVDNSKDVDDVVYSKDVKLVGAIDAVKADIDTDDFEVVDAASFARF